MVPAAIVDAAGAGKPDAAPESAPGAPRQEPAPVRARGQAAQLEDGAAPAARTGSGGESMAASIRPAPQRAPQYASRKRRPTVSARSLFGRAPYGWRPTRSSSSVRLTIRPNRSTRSLSR